MYGLKTQFIDP